MVSSARSIWTLIGVETACMLGSEISRFGISVWIYLSTQSVWAFSALMIANLIPGMLSRPLAGALVDRLPRKRVIIGANIASLVGTVIVFAGALVGELSLPIVIAGAAVASIGEAFQWPALAATLPLLAEDEDLPKYNGLLESGRALGRFAGPMIGGAAIALVGVTGLVAVEAVTFTAALVVLAAMHIPDAESDEDDDNTLWQDMLLGFKWIGERPAMLKFLLVATFANFFLAIGEVVAQPYGLSLLSEREYGIVSSLFGAGMIVGGVLCGVVARWLSNIQQFLWAGLVIGAIYVAFGFSRDVVTFGMADFSVAAMMTIANAAIMTVWQTKVPEELQGRVFSAMEMVADLVTPASFLLAAPLAESLMPAAFRHTNAGSIWGASPTGEMGALFSVMGALFVVLFLLATATRDVRRVEA
jgi:DHA3 family macrolide efflux protein-like MFS transporter